MFKSNQSTIKFAQLITNKMMYNYVFTSESLVKCQLKRFSDLWLCQTDFWIYIPFYNLLKFINEIRSQMMDFVYTENQA